MLHRAPFLLTCLLFLGACAGALGQDDDPCRPELDSKTLKLLEKGKDKRKYDAAKRLGYLQDALDSDENAIGAQFELGLLQFSQARRQGSGFGEARAHLRAVHAACPDYDAEVPYTLGSMAFAEGQFEDALDWFDRFLRWEYFTGKPHTPRANRRVQDVEKSLPQIQFLVEFNAHADSPAPKVLESVASPDQEYLPALSADGTLLFFTRAGERKAKGDLVSKPFEKFTWAKRAGPSTTFDAGVAMEDPFNRTTGYGGASISVDNRSLFLAIKTPVSGNPENIDLYSARYTLLEDTGDETVYLWSEPQPLSALNTPDGWESQPAVSPDGQWLYFAAVRPGTTPDTQGTPSIDILVSALGNNGEWGPAVPLPAPINTTFSDKAPYLHPDGHTLYFASNRTPGGGGYDIWVSRLDSTSGPTTAGAWSTPVNVGRPLNTEGDEHGLVTSADGKTAYFASRRPETRGLDILTWELPEPVRARASVVVRGQLDVSEALGDTRIDLELRYAQSRRAQAIDLGDDGAFAAVVDLGSKEDVLVVAKADGAAFSAGIVIDKDEEEPALVNANLSVRSVSEANAAFEIEDIRYASGSAEIGRASLLLLDLFAEYLSETGLSVEIGGHTDDIGSDTDNLALSEARAQAVRNYLVSAGVPAKDISAKGYGESRPRSDNDSVEGRANNRRTEFRITH
ncbi:MAG: OmpA family protein [Flavobacteriales bacterium]|nr:OmpA family protein [Flavobacteriales bacterium]